MKNKLLLSLGLLAAIVLTVITMAYSPPAATQFESFSQMWNTSNTYYGTITVATKANLGNQLDTGTNTTVLNLYTAQIKAGVVNADTFNPTPINGYGSITLVSSVLKCTNTPTVTVTPVGSLDGIHWATIPGVTVATVSPTSLTVPVVTAWNFPIGQANGGKSFLYYGLSYAGSASSTYSAQAWYYFIKPYQFVKNQ